MGRNAIPGGYTVSGPTDTGSHDVYLIPFAYFGDGCPPTTLISANARYDPQFHMKIGAMLRPLRKGNYFFIGKGAAVHKLYRNR